MQLLQRPCARELVKTTTRRALPLGLFFGSLSLQGCTERTQACDISYPQMPDVVCGDSYVKRHQSCECDGRVEKVTQPPATGSMSMGIDMGCSIVETVCHGEVKSTSITAVPAVKPRMDPDGGAGTER